MSKLSPENKARINVLSDLNLWINLHDPDTEQIKDAIAHMIKSIHTVPDQRFHNWIDEEQA